MFVLATCQCLLLMNLEKSFMLFHMSITSTIQRKAHLLKYTQIYTIQPRVNEHTEFLLTFHYMGFE